MDDVQTTVLVIASLIVLGGGGLVAYRELTAPDRRRVGVVRDYVEVLIPIVGLVALVVAAWRLF